MNQFELKINKSLTIENIYKVIDTINCDDLNFTSVRYDLSDCNWIESVGVAYLSSMSSFLSEQNKTIYFIEPKALKVQKFLKNIGFYQLVGIETQINSMNRGTNVHLNRFNTNDGINIGYIDAIVKLVGIEVPLSPNLNRVLKNSLSELFLNVKDHSSSEIGYFVLAQWHPFKRKICISVVDNGIGFYKSLSSKYPEDIHTINDAIKLSVKDGISSKSKEQNAGLGLYTIKNIIENNGGKLDIISYNGQCSFFSKGKLKERVWTNSFPGSIINIEIEPNIETLDYIVDNNITDEDDWF